MGEWPKGTDSKKSCEHLSMDVSQSLDIELAMHAVLSDRVMRTSDSITPT